MKTYVASFSQPSARIYHHKTDVLNVVPDNLKLKGVFYLHATAVRNARKQMLCGSRVTHAGPGFTGLDYHS
jgi:hypothetical protein